MIKGFLLDIDGTLLDSNDAHAKAWEYAFKHFGYSVKVDEVRTLIGMGGDRLLPTVAPDLDAEKGKGQELSVFRKKYFLEKVAPTLKPTPGARDLLRTLKENNSKLVVATSASSEELETLLKQAKVEDLVDEYVTASDVSMSKPAPDVISAALKKIALPVDEVLMVGDTPYDIAAAKKIGVKTIALRSGGFSDAQLTGAIAIYDDPADMKANLVHILNDEAEQMSLLVWKKLSEEIQGKEIIKTFQLPDNSIKSLPIWNIGKGTSIVALTEDNKVLMLREFRPGPEKVMWDLVGGFVDSDEDPLVAAKRELLEETGCEGDFKSLGVEIPSSYSNEEVYCYLATNCKKVQPQELDKGEFVKVEKVTLEKFKTLLDEGQIPNDGAAHRALRFLSCK